MNRLSRPADAELAQPLPQPSARGLGRWLVPLVLLVLVLVAGGAVVAAQTVKSLRESVELARLSEPLQHAPRGARMRLLIVGDSTGVGTGAGQARDSVAGLLAREFPLLHIENRARDGATLADVAGQLGGAPVSTWCWCRQVAMTSFACGGWVVCAATWIAWFRWHGTVQTRWC